MQFRGRRERDRCNRASPVEYVRELCATMIEAAMTTDPVIIPHRSRFRSALILAIIADALQMLVFPLFIEGAVSPVDDLLDLAVGAVLAYLLGWHWEFLPSFVGKLVPGVDLAPFWTMSVANVYRKSRDLRVTIEVTREEPPRTEPHRPWAVCPSSPSARSLYPSHPPVSPTHVVGVIVPPPPSILRVPAACAVQKTPRRSR